MKTITNGLISLSVVILLIFSCKKSNPGNEPVISLSAQTVKLSEPVLATAVGASAQMVTRWSVSPSADTWQYPDTGKFQVLFYSPGKYKITASFYADSTTSIPVNSISTLVTVTDSIYIGPPGLCALIRATPILAADQLSLIPIAYTDSGLLLLAHTEDTYGDFNPIPSIGYINLSDSSSGT